MEPPHSKDPTDANAVDADADTLDAPMLPSAIERQMAAMSALRDGKQTRQKGYSDRLRPYRLVLMSVLVLFLLVATGAAWLFTDPGRPLKKAGSAFLQTAQEASAIRNPSSADASPSIATSSLAAAQKAASETATPNAISVPLADVTLRNRPQLLEQLVQVYRLQLANNPSDLAAQVALAKLREQSLSELQIIVAQGDDATTVRSLALASRLFPELSDNTQYKYLITRMDHIHRDVKTEPAIEAPIEPEMRATALTTAISPSSISPPENSSTPKSVSPSSSSSTVVAQKSTENVRSSKPDIRVLSITPGKMVADRFVPGEQGNAFMVEISYRNFKNSENQSEQALVASLGTPGAMALAEVPVDIPGDRGTKSFLMEALLPGSVGEKYELSFILNGEFLVSRTLRLSIPEQ